MRTGEKIDADIIIVGGGAAGLMAAGRAGELGAKVLLLEKTGSIGKKILVSGKTRCNLTNSAELKDLLPCMELTAVFFTALFIGFSALNCWTFLRAKVS